METKYILLKEADFDKLVKLIEALEERINTKLHNTACVIETSKPKFITAKEVARIFGVSTRTISNWADSQEIEPYRIGGVVFYKEDEIYAAPVSARRSNKI